MSLSTFSILDRTGCLAISGSKPNAFDSTAVASLRDKTIQTTTSEHTEGNTPTPKEGKELRNEQR